MNVKTKEVLHFAVENKRLVIFPVLICTVLALGYAVFRPSWWNASQALYIRDESLGSVTRGGRFESVDAMQTAQETIYEISQHPDVLRAAMKDVGPYKKKKSKNWPTPKQVDRFRSKVSVSAPHGAQFGRTEMIYLSVADRTQERAVQLTDAVAQHLIERMKNIRQQRYASIIRELENAVEIGQQQLENVTLRIEAMESQVGMDLAELRVLMDRGQGAGNIRQAVTQIEAELRGAKASFAASQDKYRQFVEAIDDPRKLISMPNTIIDNQPTLKKLKEGLVAVQLRSSELMGVKSSRHPDVQAALNAEQRIRHQLHEELRLAVACLKSEIGDAGRRVDALTAQFELASGRMGELAAIRTRYSNLSSEVAQRAKFVDEAQSNLAVARSNQLSAASISLIQRVDRPVAGVKPLGLGRRYIAFGGVFGGALIGVGLLFLAFPVEEDSGDAKQSLDDGTERRNLRKWGRRVRDRMWYAFGRRLTDYPPHPPGYWDHAVSVSRKGPTSCQTRSGTGSAMRKKTPSSEIAPQKAKGEVTKEAAIRRRMPR